MIQRIQSVYLFLISIFSVLLITGKLFSFSDDLKDQIIIGLIPLGVALPGDGNTFSGLLAAITVLVVLIFVVSGITLFLYRQRRIQLRLSGALIILICVLILVTAWFIYSFSTGNNAVIRFRIVLVFPLLMLVCSILAFRGIKKDEDLVRSYERLR